jgi:hypothetical protein
LIGRRPHKTALPSESPKAIKMGVLARRLIAHFVMDDESVSQRNGVTRSTATR